MNIFCKYCGANINTNKDMICPNCGAELYLDKEVRDYHSQSNRINFEKDKLKLKIQQNEYEASQLKLEKEKEKTETAKKIYGFINLIRVLGFLFFIFIIGVALINSFGNPFSKKETETTIETEYVEPFHSATIGDTVNTRYYSVCLSEYDYFEPNKHMMQEGKKYLKFYFTYTNTSNEKVYSNEEILCYDDTGKEYDDYIWLNDEDENVRLDAQNVMPNKSYSGWWYFEVPNDVNQLTITFGESIEFNVDIQ